MKNIFIISCISLLFFSIKTKAQSLTALQMQNARATGYAIIAAKNPGKSFSVLMVKWDGVHDLEYNANTQINPGWHPQAAIKGNYFYQSFEGNDFTNYSSVVVSQAEFDTYKSAGKDWWIVCSTLPSFSNSSLSFSYNGNVGVNATTPNATLQIGDSNNSGSPTSEVEIKRLSLAPITHSGSDWFFTTRDNNPYANLDIGYSNNKTLTLRHDGNVGIGTSSPSESLEVYKSDNLPGTISLKSSRNDFQFVDVGRISAKQATTEVSRIGLPRAEGTNTGFITFWTKADNSEALTEKVRFSANGNVGIGTTNPTSKLTVAGNINSREVKVSVDAGADFVFEKDYALPSLQEVEKFVTENKHLPEIASAKEMQKEGINLSEMNIKLLQKIEELTLYMIEFKKENSIMEKTINTLNIEIQELKSKQNK